MCIGFHAAANTQVLCRGQREADDRKYGSRNAVVHLVRSSSSNNDGDRMPITLAVR